MSAAADFGLSIIQIVCLVLPLVAVVCCTHLKPHFLFRKLSASPLLRSVLLLLVILCSAFAGAFFWGMIAAKYGL